AASQHRDHDRHESLALREEGLEATCADDGQVGAAETGEGTRREHGVGPGGDDADSGGVESFGLLAGGAQVQPDVRRAEDPGEYGGEREAEVDDERLAEQRRLTVERLSEDGNLVEEGNRVVRGGAEAWLGAAELRLVE